MKLHPDCFPCAGNFGLRTIRRSIKDESEVWDILRDVIRFISDFDKDKTPAHLGTAIMRLVREKTGIEDPYKEDKRLQNEVALELYPYFKEMVKEAADPLGMGIKISAAGNVIDLGVSGSLTLRGQ